MCGSKEGGRKEKEERKRTRIERRGRRRGGGKTGMHTVELKVKAEMGFAGLWVMESDDRMRWVKAMERLRSTTSRIKKTIQRWTQIE